MLPTAVVLLSLAAPPTPAQVDALDSADSRDYYRSNTNWETWDSFPQNSCGEYKKFFGDAFTCSIDHKAAEEFYWNEVKKGPTKWNQNNPAFACASSSLDNMETPLKVCAKSRACTQDWLAKIKGVECRMVTGDVGPSVALEKGILVFKVGYPKKGLRPGEGHYSWWINRDLRKIFPVYDKAWKDAGLADDIF
jgi:hypothetical protein